MSSSSIQGILPTCGLQPPTSNRTLVPNVETVEKPFFEKQSTILCEIDLSELDACSNLAIGNDERAPVFDLSIAFRGFFL
jgi:hypothetical protein